MFDPEIDVKRLRLMPGDVVILTIPERATSEFAAKLTESVQDALIAAGHGETPIAISVAGVDISVLGPNEPGAMTTTGGGAPR